MNDLGARISAQFDAMLHVLGARLENRRRDDKGQTSAEYVGILVFVALLIVAIVALAEPLREKFKAVAEGAFDKIEGLL